MLVRRGAADKGWDAGGRTRDRVRKVRAWLAFGIESERDHRLLRGEFYPVHCILVVRHSVRRGFPRGRRPSAAFRGQTRREQRGVLNFHPLFNRRSGVDYINLIPTRAREPLRRFFGAESRRGADREPSAEQTFSPPRGVLVSSLQLRRVEQTTIAQHSIFRRARGYISYRKKNFPPLRGVRRRILARNRCTLSRLLDTILANIYGSRSADLRGHRA